MKTNGAGKTALIAASAMLAFLALGCGEQKERASIETSATPAAAMRQTTPAAVASTGGATETIVKEEPGTSKETLPPDVTAAAPDSLVTPGDVIEITAQASTDAQSVMLMDRLGHRYPFTYDVDAKAWRVQFRVPLDTTIDRLGLSVTATNGANRFKRVWVFLNIEGGVATESEGS